MHQHKYGVHAHIARDVDGRKMIELLKRDDAWSDNVRSFIHRPQHNTNSEAIKMNIPAGFTEKDTADTNDSGVATAVSVVYVTMSPTFSGSILGYITASPTSDTGMTDAAAATSTVAAVSSPVVQPAAISSSSTTISTSAANALTTSSAVNTPKVGTPIAQSRSSTSTAAVASATQVSDANTSQDVTVSQQNAGMSDGAKAGVAIGIILAIALAAGLVFFCWKRTKKDNSHEELNEKSQYNEKRSSFFGAGTAAGKRMSADSDKSFGTIHNTATAPRLSLRPVTQFLPSFGDKRKSSNVLGGAQMSEKPSTWERRPQNAENPFTDNAAHNDKQANPFEDGDGRSVRSNGSGKQSWEAAEPQTPQSAQFGTAAAVPVAGASAAQATAQRGPNNVHRVQLDFKPSMDDELELKSGQLVRMLHEYDDGWALCVRMDRSQQGVAPRTCLSKMPVKPRGPPPGGRVSPQGQMRGPPSGARPTTPTQQSPGLTRKPVPGQAI